MLDESVDNTGQGLYRIRGRTAPIQTKREIMASPGQVAIGIGQCRDNLKGSILFFPVRTAYAEAKEIQQALVCFLRCGFGGLRLFLRYFMRESTRYR